MSNPIPQQPSLKSVGDLDYNSLLRFFASKKFRYSLSTPPLLKDVPEGEFILDPTLLRLYITVSGVLYYVPLTVA